ncbi:MAG: two-component regulator propeller domain-containing protein [Bacteroidota bacterium]
MINILFLPGLVLSQERLSFEYIGGNKGLSENIVNDIVQDEKGFIWIATNDGLNRYDGYSMQHFRYDPSDYQSLSSNVLECLYVDMAGMLWIGTSEGGLNKYDPTNNTFTRFTNDPEDKFSISQGMVDDITEDIDGNIWVHIRDRGIDRLSYQSGKPEFIHYNTNRLGGNYHGILKSNYSLQIEKSQSGGIWVTSEKGLQKLFEDRDEAENFEDWNAYASQPIKGIKESIDDQLWIIYESGLIVKAFVGQESQSSSMGFEVKNRFEAGFVGDVSLSLDKEGNLWFGSQSGLHRVGSDGVLEYNSMQGSTSNLPTDQILATFIDRNNILWLGTYNHGALNYDFSSQSVYQLNDLAVDDELQKHPFFRHAVHSFCEDRFGALWIGTEGGGIMRIHDGHAAFAFKDQSKKTAIDLISQQGIDFSDILLDDKVLTLFSDSRNRIWIGTQKGLSKVEIKDTYHNDRPLRRSDLEVETYSTLNELSKVQGSGSVFVIKEDPSGSIWISCWGGGLQRYNETENTFERFSHDPSQKGTISHNTVRAVLFEPDGSAWVGTAGGGLNRMIFPEGPFETPFFIPFTNNPNDPESISGNYISNLVKDRNGDLWIGTFGGGLNRLSLSGDFLDNASFQHFTSPDQLPNNTIKAIQIDENDKLWATTNRELFILDTKSRTIDLILENEDFKLDEFKDNASYAFENGYMLWGGIGGLVLFDPKEFELESGPIKTCLTSLSIDNQQVIPAKNGIIESSIQYTDQIGLNYDQNTIELAFAGMYMSNTNRNKYKYYLEGYDDEWTVTSRNYANYTKVHHGTYVFSVMSSRDGIIWNGEARRLLIKINPPFWESTFAFILYGALVVMLGYLLYRLVVFRVELKSKMKIEQIKHEQKELTYNLKLEFFTNISHELRTPLTLISNPIEKLVSDTNLESGVRQKLHHIIQRNAIRLNQLINQLLDFRKMESGAMRLSLTRGDIIPFIYEIFKAFEGIADRKLIKYRFNCSENTLECLYDNDKIEKILSNLLTNAMKFTPSGGTVLVNLSSEKRGSNRFKKKTDDFLKIEISDDGIGIPVKDHVKIFERFYQNKDAETDKAMGAGIGLAYTYNLIKLHNGDIQVDSSPGNGTKFTIYLPMDKHAYKEEEITNSVPTETTDYLKNEIKGLTNIITEQPLTSITTASKKKLHTLLLVEDNYQMLYYLENELFQDYNIITAVDGAKGVEIAKENIPDLIVADLMMPEMDGYEMCKVLKTEETTCHIPIVILTARVGIESEKKGLESGADEYLNKPFDIELLKLRIRNLLQTKTKLFEQFRHNSDQVEFRKAKNTNEKEFIQDLTKIIKENLDKNEFDIETLGQLMGYSRSALYKKIKAITDMSTTEYIRYVRLSEATKLLKENKYTISQVTYLVGFSDPKYFRNCFKKVYGKLPSEYIRDLQDHKIL